MTWFVHVESWELEHVSDRSLDKFHFLVPIGPNFCQPGLCNHLPHANGVCIFCGATIASFVTSFDSR